MTDIEAIKARHEADKKDTRFERYANQAHADRATLLSALSASEARAEAAEEALRPFAAIADQMSNWTGGTQVNITMYHVGAPTVIRHAFCVRDVNAAARALKGAPE